MTSGKRQPRSGSPEPKISSKKAKLQAEKPKTSKEAATKPAGNAKQSRATADAACSAKRAEKDSNKESKQAAQDTVVGSGRQAAQGVEYKEQAALALPDSRVAVKQEQVADNELAALEHTKTDAAGPRRWASSQSNYRFHQPPVQSVLAVHM